METKRQDTKNISGVLFVDLKSAFDTVPHNRLLDKVKKADIFNVKELNLLTFLLRNTHIAIGENVF